MLAKYKIVSKLMLKYENGRLINGSKRKRPSNVLL